MVILMTQISQGSVVIRLRLGRNFSDGHLHGISLETAGKRILKIGYLLTKL